MPSTYTPNNGIEQPTTGEQPGTWGITVDNDLALIDSSLDGVASVALTGATQTITITNGAASIGRNRVIVFTGTPGVTCTVTVSPNTAQKWYYVVNKTNQTVIMSQGGGATVSIPTLQAKPVYCDGAGAGAAVAEAYPLNTDQITQGATNLFFANALARAAISATAPVLYNSTTGVVSAQSANGSQPGVLSSADWTTFNNKQSTISPGTTAQYWRGDLTWQALNAGAVAGLAASATTDTTNATNISSGALLLARIAQGAATSNQVLTWTGSTWAPTSLVPGSVAWGAIGGTLSAQTDLQSALNAKQATLTFTGNGTKTASSTGSLVNGDLASWDASGNAVDAGVVAANVVVSSGSYSNPSWITALANAKVTGLSASATVDATNATNIVSGSLAAARQTAMVGDSGSGGVKGAVPAPGAGDAAAGKFLKADGTWTLPGGGMKLVQRGTSNIAGIGNSSGTTTATITAVTTTKAFVNVSADWGGGVSPIQGAISVSAVLTNSTTLTFTASSPGAGTIVISWEVVEFN